MTQKEVHSKNRLEELMTQKGATVKDLAECCHVSEKTISADIRGGRTFQPERAVTIAKEYGVTLDWLYGVSDYMNPYDVMADLILALDRVFQVTIKRSIRVEGGNTYDLSEPALYISKTLYQYLKSIRELENYITHSELSKGEFQRHRKEIQDRYKNEIKAIFGMDKFSEERFIEIKKVEEASDQPTFLDFLI